MYKSIKFVLLTIVTLIAVLITKDHFTLISSGEAREKLAFAEQAYADSVREVKQAEIVLSKKAPVEHGLLEIAQGGSLELKASLDHAEQRYGKKVMIPTLAVLCVVSLGFITSWVRTVLSFITQRRVKETPWSSTQ
jgi:hypothetical protein